MSELIGGVTPEEWHEYIRLGHFKGANPAGLERLMELIREARKDRDEYWIGVMEYKDKSFEETLAKKIEESYRQGLQDGGHEAEAKLRLGYDIPCEICEGRGTMPKPYGDTRDRGRTFYACTNCINGQVDIRISVLMEAKERCRHSVSFKDSDRILTEMIEEIRRENEQQRW